MRLTEFLAARLDEDEAVARAAVITAHDAPGAYKPHGELARWRYRGEEVEYDWDDPYPYPDVYRVTCDSEGLSPSVNEDVGPHIARHDPARVLADVKAKRAILDIHEGDHHCVRYIAPNDNNPCETLMHLAAVYSDHPHYDETWRP